jgi:hypothetical protein
MRELTKSMLSFSWAFSLLGIKQAVSLVTPGSRSPGTGNILDPVTESAVAQLDESLKGIFRSGDNIQSKMVDMMLGMANPANWNVPRWSGDCGQKAARGFASPSWPNSPSSGTGAGQSSSTVNAATAGSAAGWGSVAGDTSR